MELLAFSGIIYLIARVLYYVYLIARDLFGREPERSEGDQNTPPESKTT